MKNETLKNPAPDSLWAFILLFFLMSFAGWLWEVFLFLVSTGTFVNRGFLHGPWLPIYGFGSVLILVTLRRLRTKPFLEFAAIVLLCGCLEYGASWYLELVYDGMKWWDYSGGFLNLNGRICVEGLLVFGVGGMLLVYQIAPFLHRLSAQIPKRILILVCLMLLLLFGADLSYSDEHPNTGKGITKTECTGNKRTEWRKQ